MTIEQTVEKPAKMSRQTRKMMKFYGCLKDNPAFEGDAVEIQHRLRAEWDRDIHGEA